jgi:arylformamidase
MPIFALAFIALGLATPAIVAQAGPHVFVPGPTEVRALTYGRDPRQRVELFTRGGGCAPLIVYLHGGGWSSGSPKAGSGGAQADHYTSRGHAYATIGYRFVPGVTVEQQLADVAAAIAMLRRQPAVDPQRIVLIGHSSGGHLAALLGSDLSYLVAAGVPEAAVRGVVLLDPAAIDIGPIMATGGGGTVDRYYRPAFGDDPARWSALSPMKHSAGPNAPRWLMLYDVNNPLAGMQSGEFAAGLIGAGAEARVEAVTGTSHVRLNDEIGAAGDLATALIDAFLAEARPESRRPRFR